MPEKIARFYRRCGWLCLLLAVLSVPWLVPSAQAVLAKNYNDVTEWLPAGFQATEDLNWFVRRFGGDEILAASWDGCTLDDPRLVRFAEALQAAKSPSSGEPLFRRVFHGPGLLEELQEEPLELTRADALQRMSGWLVGPDGETSCAVALITPGASRHEAVGAVLQAADEAAGISRKKLYVGGPTVDSVAIDDVTNRSLYWMTGSAFLISIVVAWFALRSLPLTGIVFATAVYCQLFALNLMHWTGQHMNSVLIMLPALVFVLSISAAIHVVNYFLDAVSESGWESAVGHTVLTSLKPCGLAAATTSLGLGSLGLSEIVPIQKFGFYAAAGTLAGLVLLFLLLPSALQVLSPWIRRERSSSKGSPSGSRSASNAKPSGGHLRLSRGVLRGQAIILPVGFVVLALVGSGVVRVESAVKLKSLFRPDAEVMRNYRWLEEHIGPLIPVEIVLRFGDENASSPLERMEVIRRLHGRVSKLENTGGVISTATFAPQPPEGTGGRSIVQRRIYESKLRRHGEELEDSGYLRNDPETGEELWRLTARVPAMTDVDYDQHLALLETTTQEVLEEGNPPKTAGVPQASRSFTSPQAANNVDFILCGGIPLFNSASKQLLEDLRQSFLAAFGLIAVVMLLILWGSGRREDSGAGRDILLLPPRGLLAMVPNLFPALLIFGTMGWLGMKVDIGAMMTASVAMGIAVDDTVHFLTWFQQALQRGRSRAAAVLFAYRKCAAAMTQTTLVCGVGLLPFAPSEFVPISRFSGLMAASLLAALLGDLLLLPALLASPLGRCFSPAKCR